MDIKSHLWLSRHGVYYFRRTKLVLGRQVSKKLSLGTKDPKIAKSIAISLLAQMPNNKFEVTINSDGVSFKTNPDDVNDAHKLNEFMKNNKELISQLAEQQNEKVKSNPFTKIREEQLIAKELIKKEDGINIDIVVEKFVNRKKTQLGSKTLQGYLNYIKIFSDWYKKQYSMNAVYINHIDRKIISKYIEYLQSENISTSTVEKNYLGALNAIFEFGKITGDFQDAQVPSKGHKLTTKKEIQKNKKERNPFTEDELKIIFDPINLNPLKHPEQFWIPLIALFTGARLSEICQLSIKDILLIDNIYAISITDEGEDQILKSLASKRIIPIHQTILDIGFLEYIEDVKNFNGKLFPDLQPDIYGYYGKEPSRRWGNYLDKIGIKDPSKVFHSFRSTANSKLRLNDITEEIRCEFVGHDHDTINTKHYSQKYPVKFLSDKVLPALTYDVDFSKLKYKPHQFTAFIKKELIRIENKKKRKAITEMRKLVKKSK